MASPTPNKGYTYPAHGGSVNAWDTPLNTNFDYIDLNLGGTYPITIVSTAVGTTYNSSGATISSTVAAVTLPSSLAQNLYYKFSGTQTQNVTISFPAIGGIYDISNTSSGAFSLTANTVAVGSSGAVISQGGRNIVIADGTNVVIADTNVLAKLTTFLGNPNTNVAGTAATANGGTTDVEWDATNKNLYACTTTGTAATAVWTPVASKLVPQGVLSVSTDNNNPIIAADVLGSTTVKYLPYLGNWTLISDGTTIYPYQFSAMTLTLTANQIASTYVSGAITVASIYDIFIFWNSGTPVIGTGPAWTAGTAGSGTPGSCARGTGAGGTSISRLSGTAIWVNTVAVTLTNGASTYACPASQGVYLGSILIDSTAGQVTCHRSYGQSRKWGVFNAFNREAVILQAGDNTASSWTYSTNTVRASNNLPANSLTVFCGLPEEITDIEFIQAMETNGSVTGLPANGIGVNSTTAASGKIGFTRPTAASASGNDQVSRYILSPAIGINIFSCLEKGGTAGTVTWYGGNSNMVMAATWKV